MAKIVRLKNDITLTYSWSFNNHGICGHTYEVIEYYFILKEFFDVGIMLCEDITPYIFDAAIRDKYNFSEDEITDILSNTEFHNRPSLVQGNTIIFTDGGLISMKAKTLLFKNIIMFACGDKTVMNVTDERYYILQDFRIYDPGPRSVSYKKKILFNRLKEVSTSSEDILVYATKNCRAIDNSMYMDIEDEYDNNFILLTSSKVAGLCDRWLQEAMPVKNLFSRFGTYIYTPVPRRFDCSSRFICECKWYNKKVIYHKEVLEYLKNKEDLGLYYRKYDVDNDFDTLILNRKDSIVNIIYSIMHKEEDVIHKCKTR